MKPQKLIILIFYVITMWFLLNFVTEIIIKAKKKLFPTNFISQTYGKEKVKKAYPNLKEKEINQLLNEIWGRKYEYDNWTGFKEKKFSGKYLNIHQEGFRITKNELFPPNPKNYNIFIFGGSHSFGYGVKNNETIAYFLQDYFANEIVFLHHNKNSPNGKGLGVRSKEIKIYNFSSAFYYSEQERARFIQLLTQNYIPDLVIFFDGLNEFYFNEPYFTNLQKKLFDNDALTMWHLFLQNFPLMKKNDKTNLDNISTLSIIKTIQRYQNNIEFVYKTCKSYDIQFLAVWQPVPFFEYDLKYHLFSPTHEKRIEEGYILMQNYQPNFPFLNLSDIQKNTSKNWYIDKVHYSPEMNKIIAKKIIEYIKNEFFE
jgi:lysophospholipase L1-like esterase